MEEFPASRNSAIGGATSDRELTECEIILMYDIPDGCTIWNGDLVIHSFGTANISFPYLIQKMSQVKQVNGRISILGTDFQNFSFLSSLEKIYYKPTTDFKSFRDSGRETGKSIAFRIENNSYVETLGMDKLKSVVIDALPTDQLYYATLWSVNPKLCFDLSQTDSWLESPRMRIPQFSYCNMNIIEEGKVFKKFRVGNDTRVYCSMKMFNGSMPMGCQILDSGIWIKDNMNETELEYFSEAIQSVEVIYGPIVVKNSTIKKLNFKNLRLIHNMYFDVSEVYGGLSKQVIELINNDILTELSLPKLESIHHYGPEAFIITSGNGQLKCAKETCDLMLQLFRFDLGSCNCGIVPKFNPGYSTTYMLTVIFESTICAMITIFTYGTIMYKLYVTGFSVSYFQLSMLIYLWLCCIEAVYNVLNNIKFFDGLNYPWCVGLQFLLFSNKERYFYQAVNIIYTNRISLLLSCCLYRTISFISFDYGKIGMAISFMVFIVSNIWSFNSQLQTVVIGERELQGSQWSYGIYIINWTTFAVSIVSAIFLFFYLRKNFENYSDMIQHQNRLSMAFFFQALLSFVFCGFPDVIFENWFLLNDQLSLVRSRRVFSYYYSSTIIRWHYVAYALLIRVFLNDMISKVNLQSTAHVATTSTKSAMLRYLLTILLCSAGFELANGTDCVVSFPFSQLPDNCTTMTGDLTIDGKNTSYVLANHLQYSVLVQKLSHVETWTGTIKILNTDFPNLAFFKSLKSVTASWPHIIFLTSINYASFWIESNPNMTTLEMPNLVDVKANNVLPTNELIYSLYISENYDLCMSEVEFLRFRTLERSLLINFRMCGVTIQKYCFANSFSAKNIPLGCQILMSGIWIRDETNTSLQAHLNEAFSTVEEVHGPIVIFRTDFTNLSFPVLHTIRNQFYDGQNSWQWQVLIIRGNYFLTSFQSPKLRNFYHYGSQPQLTNSANYIWTYNQENCEIFRRIPFFSVTDKYSNCGLIPIFNDEKLSPSLVVQVGEKIASFAFNFILSVYLAFRLFKSDISVTFFHFAMVTLIFLTITENLYVNLDYVHIFNENGFAIPYGIRSLFITRDATLFNQISNVMYVNRLTLLSSCSIYRSMYLTNPHYEKYGLLISCALFVLSNVWNLSVMENLGNKYTYVLYQFNWITLLLTLFNGVFIMFLTSRKSWIGSEKVKLQHNRLSISMFCQAFSTFVFCGYSEGLNQFFKKNYQFIDVVNQFETFFYYYGGIVMRWHYSVLILITIIFLPSTFVKFPQSTKVTTVGSVSKN